MNDCKIYDTENESDMLELEGEYSETQINEHCRNIFGIYYSPYSGLYFDLLWFNILRGV